MEAQNLLIIMDDEHNKNVLGYNGHPVVQTPNLDRLASGGTTYERAYSSSPICVPARAAFATGRYVHDNRCWDNAIAYDGSMPSWAHVLRDSGHLVTSIGKLHYTGEDIDGGFTEQIIPMHIEAGVGDLFGLIRDPLPTRHQSADLARSIGPGESSYIRYDRDITEKTINWLRTAGKKRHDKPWVLYSSFMAPHSPLIAPQEFYDMYPAKDIVLPSKRVPYHPWIKAWNDCYGFDSYFESDEHRRIAIASYYGLCSFLDSNVGKIMHALEETGLAQNTRVLFLSDHGDNLGSRALWGKSTMYEESCGVPMIASGPGIQAGRRVKTPVSHVDCFPSFMQAVGSEDLTPKDLPGRSIFDIADKPYDDKRTVFSEYHAAGGVSAAYMLRKGDFKYIHYTGLKPELFNLAQDPDEVIDLATDATMSSVLENFQHELEIICDPVAMDLAAKHDQAALIRMHGGVEKILNRGGSSYTPIPGEAIKLMSDGH
ncbi:sulfatase-like hydrolase/transferase [Comamonas thiooxydans]|uniref:sulfatase-like hydrolase/transferase n=1 Tax=Comamonas thiooxydans TaxID=363952 RepID=UPI000A2E7E3B|nr:sulfatase-like hydrolase/transferase [Comamonas thiooxydans]BDR09305.1 sulfatase-like hydrolase/transferase [Comamonas thiooxydans]